VKNNLEDYYVNIKWMAFVIPVLWVGIYEVLRFQILGNIFTPIINSVILICSVGFFGLIFSAYLFRKIRTIHNSLFLEQQKLKTIFHHTSDGIIVLGENCQILDINPAVEKLTGWKAKEVIKKITCEEMNRCLKSTEACWNSQNPEGCMNVDCGHRECWGKTCLEKQISVPHVEMCLVCKNGKKIKVAASYSYIPAVGEEKPLVKLVLRDISEKKEFEKAIQNYATLEERYRLAREMHDGLAQALVYLNIKAYNIQKNLEKHGNHDSIINDLVEIRQVTQEAVNEVRQNIFDLKTPPRDETSCFRVWIEDYLKNFGFINHLDTEFFCNCQAALILPTDVKVQLIRIIQEALTNIRKHARATKINIFLTKNEKKLIIKITDNGKGIDLTTLNMDTKEHFGLTIMKERAQIIGGDIKIIPGEARGTLVELTLPLINGYERNNRIAN